MLNRRQCKRFRECVDVEFVSDGKSFTGTSDDFSLNGLFIMSRDVKAPGTVLDIAVRLPNRGATLKLRGTVIRLHKTVAGEVIGAPDGMGVEIIEKDANYLHFFRSLLPMSEKDSSSNAPQMDVELMQPEHKVPMPGKRANDYEEGQRDLHDKPQLLKGREKEQERHHVLLDPENKKNNNKSFDDMLFELISKGLKA